MLSAAPVRARGLRDAGSRPALARHSLPRLLAGGLCATVNSDDPAYFGGYVNANFQAVFAATGLDSAAAYQLAANSFEASFADAALKQQWLDKLQAAFERAHDAGS